jgi:hypothetical protein
MISNLKRKEEGKKSFEVVNSSNDKVVWLLYFHGTNIQRQRLGKSDLIIFFGRGKR